MVHMDESVFSPVKRKFESNDSDQSSKIHKLAESIDNDISINLDSQCIPSLTNNNLPDLSFNGLITGPVDMAGELLLGSINKLTPMRMRIASCIGLESEPILINRDICNRILGANLHQYYSSPENRLENKFQHNIFLIPVIADGNCFFRALFHIIFGTESKYESFKHHLIAKFRSSPFHFFNEMNKLEMTEQQLLDHLTRISAPNEWGTDLELRMLGALAGIDVVSINAMYSDCDRWRLDPIYNHAQLTPPLECDPLYQVRN